MCLSLREDDVTKLLAVGTHLDTTHVDFQVEQYLWRCTHYKFGEKLGETPTGWSCDCILERYLLFHPDPMVKEQYCNLENLPNYPKVRRFSPGSFTNHIQAAFREPRLVFVTDTDFDSQPITETSYVNIPVIALCDAEIWWPCYSWKQQIISQYWAFMVNVGI